MALFHGRLVVVKFYILYILRIIYSHSIKWTRMDLSVNMFYGLRIITGMIFDNHVEKKISKNLLLTLPKTILA